MPNNQSDRDLQPSNLLQCSLCGSPVILYGRRGIETLIRCTGCGFDSGTLKSSAAPAPRQPRRRRRDPMEGVEVIRRRR